MDLNKTSANLARLGAMPGVAVCATLLSGAGCSDMPACCSHIPAPQNEEWLHSPGLHLGLICKDNSRRRLTMVGKVATVNLYGVRTVRSLPELLHSGSVEKLIQK